KAEFKKIVWPDRPEVVKKTATVVVTSLIIGAIIFCMDTVFNAGYGVIIGLLG
ncbi:MAG: preprotein translocase subunit SecE, partial [Anaerotignum sp.]|nr:preprotein translocase subunit SecE [Anaerotignum sp.]